MKNINVYVAEKYKSSKYEEVEQNIYKTRDELIESECYVTSLSFEQELEYGEGTKPSDISQDPLEDILDKFCVAVNDFYEEENSNSPSLCYLEFMGTEMDDIKELLSIVGKHVYNKVESESIKLIIE